ncbi:MULTISPECIES: DUF4145 domain-containing protein [Agrobacterium]|uniref:DUF4145 domain-containing protein n=1 Tax=Agrobacterium TaxID=357 RepID=UPI0009EC0069|nr:MULTISPECIES: DUF4145 domain-containing protein [Agrobacterium]NSX85711.1 DUF4145 domain-containing protein [Agrobacterium tumefaciens]
MRCSHCLVNFHDNWLPGTFYRRNQPTGWTYHTAACPACERLTIVIENDDGEQRIVEPISTSRGPISNFVPSEISIDYTEACNVLPISPKASAALARRCLQNILNTFGYKAKDLAKQVDALINETDPKKALPIGLHETIDAIRNFGNFSAHPIDEKTTLQVIDVEAEEAEWCLEILEELFEHFYERPAIAAQKKAALDAKLAAAGKPPSK